MTINKPKYLKQPFATNGDRSVIKDTITSEEEQQGKASYDKGFPNVTMIPKEAGGLPPLGQDMNGILYELSENIVYSQAGGTYNMNEDILTNRSGYPKNALLVEEDNKIYLSKHDNNTSNYKTDASLIGTDWDIILPDNYIQRIIGEVIYTNRTDDGTIDGCLKCDGKTYNVKDYEILVNNYIKTNKLKYVSFGEYRQELTNSNNNSCYYFGYETDGDSFRVPTINTSIQFYNAFIVVSDVYGTPMERKNYNVSKDLMELELIDEFDIREPLKYLEIKNIDDTNYRHKIIVSSLRCDSISSSSLYCQISCDGNYVTDNVYGWSNCLYNSGESYSYVKYKTRINSYQLTNDKYPQAEVTGIGEGYFDLELEILDNKPPYHMLRSNALKFKNVLYNTADSTCGVYNEGRLDGIRLYIDNNSYNLTKGHVRHYVIK